MMVRENNQSGLEEEPSSKLGKFLSHPAPGEEVVISGMSGMFPLADNIEEFKHNLDNKIEMISQIPSENPELPPGFGKLKDLTRFDTGFFGLHKRHVLPLNPLAKLIMERCYECIFDAGLNPSDLEGTKTGVFLGLCFSEAEQHWFLLNHVQGGNSILGNIKGVFANQISYALKLKGPSYVVDTACSSCAYALEAAYKAIRMGQCEAALVAGCNYLLAGGLSLQFARLGVLSMDGHCRPFDVDGNGYVRSEAVVAVLLQKAKVSNRIYATLVHTKTNCDGYKEEGITYPSGAIQYNLLNEIYFESGIKPTDVGFVEVHGTGTAVGDPVELSSVDQFFTPGRKEPLLIGSVKSSIGHSEPVAALCSLLKVLLAFENEVISPNINFKTPRQNIRSILEGRLQVVVENTPFRDPNGLAGLSSFGFGGSNAHAIVKQFNKAKIGKGRPIDNTPRLVCVSGRTEEAVNVLLDDVADKCDAEHMALIHNIFSFIFEFTWYNPCLNNVFISPGKLLVEKLLRSCKDIGSIYITVRAKKGKDVQTRVEEYLNNWVFKKLSEINPNYKEKIVAINGDFIEDGLGMSEATVEMLKEKINIIYHVAATVRFDEKLAKAVKLNIRGTMQLIQLAKQCKNLEVFLYVSTAYSNFENQVINEEFYPPYLDPYKLIKLAEELPEDVIEKITPGLIGSVPNTYVYSKQIAEDIVRRETVGIPACIVRPSIVTSSVREPLRSWIDTIYGPAGLMEAAALGLLHVMICKGDGKCDLVPVDYAINSCIASSYKAAEQRQIDKVEIFNFTLSNENLLYWKNLGLSTRQAFKVGSPKILFSYFIVFTSCYYWYIFLNFLLHTIPGYVMDFFLKLFGQKPILTMAYQKIGKFATTLSYFTLNEWTFTNTNTVTLWHSLNEIDKKNFPFDMKTLNWQDYFDTYMVAMREFLMNDFLDTLDEGRRHMIRMDVIFYVTVTSATVLSIYYLLNSVFFFIPLTIVSIIIYYIFNNVT